MSTPKQDRTPYTYLVGWTHLNKWYYGRRTAKGCRPQELWVKYFTSSARVKSFRQQHGEPDVMEIRKIFNSVSKCKAWENKFLIKIDAKNNNLFLNESNGDKNFDTTGLIGTCAAIVAVTGEKLGRVSVTDPRWQTGEIISTSKNRKQSDSERSKRSSALRGKPSPLKGTKGKPCSIETKEKLSIINTGKIMDPQTKIKISESLTGFIRSEAQREHYKGPKSPEAVEKGKKAWLALSTRTNVIALRELAKEHNVLLGKGWTRKSDEWINLKLTEIQSLSTFS